MLSKYNVMELVKLEYLRCQAIQLRKSILMFNNVKFILSITQYV